MLATLAAQGPEHVQTTGIPLIVLVTGFISAMLILSGWLLSLERRKVDKRDFEKYSSGVEGRMSATHMELIARLQEITNIATRDRDNILSEIRELRRSLHHGGGCPYLEEKGREGS